jgi:DNA-directed RNA polymerase subunit N (RpoN/RPB10)
MDSDNEVSMVLWPVRCNSCGFVIGRYQIRYESLVGKPIFPLAIFEVLNMNSEQFKQYIYLLNNQEDNITAFDSILPARTEEFIKLQSLAQHVLDQLGLTQQYLLDYYNLRLQGFSSEYAFSELPVPEREVAIDILPQLTRKKIEILHLKKIPLQYQDFYDLENFGITPNFALDLVGISALYRPWCCRNTAMSPALIPLGTSKTSEEMGLLAKSMREKGTKIVYSLSSIDEVSSIVSTHTNDNVNDNNLNIDNTLALISTNNSSAIKDQIVEQDQSQQMQQQQMQFQQRQQIQRPQRREQQSMRPHGSNGSQSIRSQGSQGKQSMRPHGNQSSQGSQSMRSHGTQGSQGQQIKTLSMTPKNKFNKPTKSLGTVSEENKPSFLM